MVTKFYRIYIGARNTPNHTFLPKDERLLRQTLARYFKGWTVQNAEGHWGRAGEETRVISVCDMLSNHRRGAGKSPLESCVAQLKNDLKQSAILVEAGGIHSFF